MLIGNQKRPKKDEGGWKNTEMVPLSLRDGGVKPPTFSKLKSSSLVGRVLRAALSRIAGFLCLVAILTFIFSAFFDNFTLLFFSSELFMFLTFKLLVL